MVNTNELRAKIVSKGMTQQEVAKALNMSSKTFSLRMKKGIFGSDEIDKLIEILEIQQPLPIFFAQLVT